MGDFQRLPLKAVYKTEHDDILRDFYIPTLKEAKIYHRAVGFFSAAALSYAAEGFSVFCSGGGTMKLIFGASVSKAEEDAILEGYDHREFLQRISDDLISSFPVDDALFENRLQAISWLIATNRLDIKIALRRQGMYHEKIGIMWDAFDNALVFQGSGNETAYALLPEFNYESINVFKRWEPAFIDHCDPHIESFEQLWKGEAPKTRTVEFPEAVKDQLLRLAEKNGPPKPDYESGFVTVDYGQEEVEPTYVDLVRPGVPSHFDGREFRIKPHQSEALNAWQEYDYSGILALATGAGKTITAIYGFLKVFEKKVDANGGRFFLCISVPYVNLAEQWQEVLRKFSILSIGCFGNREKWLQDLHQEMDEFELGARNFICVVSVNRTFSSEHFQSVLSRVPSDDLFFIGDECHHQTSSTLQDKLPKARYKIGLSATPENFFNFEASQRLLDYYGGIAYEYDLRRALEEGILTKYDYEVHVVYLTDDEAEDYIELSRKISQLIASSDGGIDFHEQDDGLKPLLMRRARIVGSASEKLKKLQEILKDTPPEPLTLFYCGDGSVDSEDVTESMRQIELISEILHHSNWRTSRYTSRETPKTRRSILEEFRIKVLDAMVAIRCLDEGIDIPACHTAYLLASSRNSRQFIQRRGRILRKAPGKEKSRIIDFLVALPETLLDDTPDFERRLFSAELARCAEFANLSLNPTVTYRVLEPLLKRYDLTDRINVSGINTQTLN
jgi:superfamily II DNA or RNA helicase